MEIERPSYLQSRDLSQTRMRARERIGIFLRESWTLSHILWELIIQFERCMFLRLSSVALAVMQCQCVMCTPDRDGRASAP